MKLTRAPNPPEFVQTGLRMSKVVTGKSLDSPENGNVDKMSENRVFLNLWFAKPMVWVRVAFHENDGNHENDENDEDNSDS